MAIHFDETNLKEAMVGPHGVSAGEVSAAMGKAREAVKSFRAKVEDGRYGFPDLPNDRSTMKAVLEWARTVEGSYDTVCVVGIGGSALGAWAVDCAMRGPHPVQPAFTTKNPRLVILDNVDPSFVVGALASMNPKKTLVVVIAKSGATAETVAAFLMVREWLEQALGKKAKRRIAAVTSAGRGDLKTLATAEDYTTFHLPDNVGGRFSVLSAVGLVPAALTGVDVKALLKGAAAMTAVCWNEDPAENPALRAALYHWLAWTAHDKPIQVAFPYSNKLWGMAFWFRQLWAESLGKRYDSAGKEVYVGQTPVAALGTTDQHSQVQLYMEGPNDKVFSFWTVGKFDNPGRIPKAKTGLAAMDYLGGQTLAKLLDAEQRATAAALTEEGRPNCTYSLDKVDAGHIGGLFQLLEFQTAYAGELLGVDAFDQPGVELGKKYTFGLMGREEFSDYRERFRAYEARRNR